MKALGHARDARTLAAMAALEAWGVQRAATAEQMMRRSIQSQRRVR
jgi:exosome complex RNA-binding protein Rrp42 (RNase PH superfamily)